MLGVITSYITLLLTVYSIAFFIKKRKSNTIQPTLPAKQKPITERITSTIEQKPNTSINRNEFKRESLFVNDGYDTTSTIERKPIREPMTSIDKNESELEKLFVNDGYNTTQIASLLSIFAQGKRLHEEQHMKSQMAYDIIQNRLEQYGYTQKLIQSDGNCMFNAIADQLDISGFQLRQSICVWLKENQYFRLDNDTQLFEYVNDMRWDVYCENMQRDGEWGDHICLIAIAEMYNTKITIVSSIQSDNHFITITPSASVGSDRHCFIAHISEYHYNSVIPIQQNSQSSQYL